MGGSVAPPQAGESAQKPELPRLRNASPFAISLPEWGVLIGVLTLLLAIFFPAWEAWRRHNRLAMARSDIRAMQAAISRYQREYGTWPSESSPGAADIRYGARRPNAVLMRILRSDANALDRESRLNPQHMIFIEIERYQKGFSGLNDSDEFLDPWGSPYQIALDSNYDGAVTIENSIYGRVLGAGALIWSLGPDRKSETSDDLLSWDRIAH